MAIFSGLSIVSSLLSLANKFTGWLSSRRERKVGALEERTKGQANEISQRKKQQKAAANVSSASSGGPRKFADWLRKRRDR